MPASRPLAPYFLLVLPPLFWACNAVAGRFAVEIGLSPFGLAFWRWVVALALLLPLTARLVAGEWAAVRRNRGRLLVLGVLSVGGFNLFLYLALQTTTALNATLVGATMPLVIMVIARLWLGDPMGPARVAGLALSIAGVALVVARGDLDVLLGLELRAGDGFMLVAVATWATYSVMLRAKPPGVSPPVLLTSQIVGGLILVAPLYAVTGALGVAAVPAVWESAALIGFVAVFPALLAFWFWNQGVAAVGAPVAGFYTNLVPLFTAGLAALLLGEPVRWYHGVGLAAIFAGIVLATRGRRGRGRSAAKPT